MSGIGLLAPWVLAAAVAVAVPIIAHLARHEDRQGRAFPSLMFLSRMPFSARSRRRLQDRALLALRLLALLALVLAFAGPYPLYEDGAPAPGSDTVVLLDVSYSMGLGERFEQARAQAASALAAAAARGRVALLVFDGTPRTVSDLDAGAEAARAALDRAAPGSGGTDIAGALDGAARVLAASAAGERRVVLVSDLQSVGLGADPRLPADVQLELRPVGGPLPGNLALTAAWRDAGGDGVAVALRARVANTGGGQASARLRVTVDGLAAGEHPLTLAPGESRDLDVPVFAAEGRPTRVQLRLDGDALAADDVRHLVISPSRPLSVLLVSAVDGGAPHLAAALALARDPPLRVRRAAPADLSGQALAGVDVVILDGAAPDAASRQALAAHLGAGAGLLAFAGEGSGEAGAPVSAQTAFGPLAGSHPLAAGLAGGELSGIRVWRYLRASAGAGDAVLARYDDGAPALLEGAHGAGRSLAFTTAAAPGWSDLVIDPVFLPLVLESVAYLARHRPVALDHAPGSVLDVARHAAAVAGGERLARALAGGESVLVRSPSGREQRLRQGLALRLDEAGFFELRAGTGAALPVAVSVDGRESDLAALEPAQLLARLRRDAPAGAAPAPRTQADDQRLARWLLVAAACLLLAEGLAAALLSRRRQPAQEAG